MLPESCADTHPEAERAQIDLLRKATLSQRFARACSLTATTIALARRAIARANPGLSPGEVDLMFVEVHYGRELAARLRRCLDSKKGPNMATGEVLEALTPVVEALETLGVPYYVGGSIASSALGKARSTLDVDLVADLAQEHVAPLVERLRSAYYVDGPMISDAIARKSCFNVIHLATMFKVDVFAVKERPYDRVAMGRIRGGTLTSQPGAREFFLASPEDVVLNKLEWFRLGDEVARRQWNDAVGVLKVQRDCLDRAYLAQWAAELGVADLLNRAWGETEA
jgi:hypothetical protein